MQSRKQLRREAKQLFRLCLVEGLLDEDRVRQAVEKVVEAKRRGGFTLLSYFQRLVRLECSRHTAEVASATALPAEFAGECPGESRAPVWAGVEHFVCSQSAIDRRNAHPGR